MLKKYKEGDVVDPYTLITYLGDNKWSAKCNICNSIVDVFTSNLGRQKMCRNCRTAVAKIQRVDITGQRKGRLTIKEYLGNSKWLCLCDCGNEVVAATGHLNSGHTQSCGCYMRNQTSKANIRDLTGDRFTNLVVLYRTDDYVTPKGKHCIKYRCLCDCGMEIDVLGTNLLNENTKSCGCLNDSYGEYQIRMFLERSNIIFTTEYIFTDLKSPNGGFLRFDFAIYNSDHTLNCLIEFQGIQHFKEQKNKPEFGKFQREVTDELKLEYCKRNNIKLYSINFDDDIEIKIKEIIKEYNACQSRAKQADLA